MRKACDIVYVWGPNTVDGSAVFDADQKKHSKDVESPLEFFSSPEEHCGG